MTKSAWLFLCLTIVTGIFGLGADSQDVQTHRTDCQRCVRKPSAADA